jgi:hypothetical protein
MEWFEQGPIFGARDSGLAGRRFHAARCDEVLEKRGFKKLRRPRFEVAENPGWSQWVEATLSSDPHSIKTKAKSAGEV